MAWGESPFFCCSLSSTVLACREQELRFPHIRCRPLRDGTVGRPDTKDREWLVWCQLQFRLCPPSNAPSLPLVGLVQEEPEAQDVHHLCQSPVRALPSRSVRSTRKHEPVCVWARERFSPTLRRYPLASGKGGWDDDCRRALGPAAMARPGGWPRSPAVVMRRREMLSTRFARLCGPCKIKSLSEKA